MIACPLCGLEIPTENVKSLSSEEAFKCERCGDYLLSREMAARDGWSRDPYLSAATRQASEAGSPILISPDNWSSLAEAHRRTSVSARVDKALRYLASKGRPGTKIWINMILDYPVAGAVDEDEFQSYLVHLDKEEGLIRAFSMERAKEGIWGYVTTVRGWRYLEPTPISGTLPGTCFVAMWFDPTLKEVYDMGFDPGIRGAGFLPLRVDQTPTNRGISDEVLARIRSSEFVVADFTGQRQSVYYEAGFARGLGKEVIWSCRSSEIASLHFDIKHLGHVVWDEASDLRTKLRDSIHANIIRRATDLHNETGPPAWSVSSRALKGLA